MRLCLRGFMVEPDFLRFSTLSLRAGHQPDSETGARAVPIYRSTSFMFDDTEHAASLFNLEEPGHIYSRISNPTTAVLEERLAALEGDVGAVCTASTMSAFHLGAATLMEQGGHIVAARNLYGGAANIAVTPPRASHHRRECANPASIPPFESECESPAAIFAADDRCDFGNPIGWFIDPHASDDRASPWLLPTSLRCRQRRRLRFAEAG
jgi:O-acetylhomoserine/O-acetylserine sulfhydrylase-like pyridoxal-dependent enzyme